MKVFYVCQVCEETFEQSEECQEHEKKCKKYKVFTCDRCGYQITYPALKPNDSKDQCWEVRLGRAGYGSYFDGSDIEFDLCDACLKDVINSLSPQKKESILNSGSNYHIP